MSLLGNVYWENMLLGGSAYNASMNEQMLRAMASQLSPGPLGATPWVPQSNVQQKSKKLLLLLEENS